MRDAQQRDTCKAERTKTLVALNQARAALAKSPDAKPLQLDLQMCQEDFARADAALRTAQQKSLRPGSDLVFSAPKSVSMQWAALLANGDTAGAISIEQAHDQAVRTTFEQIQSQFVMTRKRGEQSERILETVQGVIACQWRHFDARPTERTSEAGASIGNQANTSTPTPPLHAGLPDPQLHDHINLFAPVKGSDGAIYAAYTDYIRHNLKALGAMYRAHLSQNLVANGYRVERDAQAQGLFFALSGIGRDQAKALSARTADIEALQSDGMPSSKAKLYSRKAKNQRSGWEVIQAWQSVFSGLGVDPQQVKSASMGDSIALDAWHRGLNAEEAAAFARSAARERMPGERTNATLLDALLEREAYFSLSDIRQMLWEDAQFVGAKEKDLDSYVERRLRKLLQSPALLQVSDPQTAPPSLSDAKHASLPARSSPTGQLSGSHLTGLNRYAEPVFTTHALLKREQLLFDSTLPRLLGNYGYGVDATIAANIVAKIEGEISKRQIAGGGKPFALRDFQLAAVMQAVCGDNQLCIQIAGAGMGKTTSAQFVKEILSSQGRTLIGVAPSNKAASGLSRELGIPTSSIDRLLIDLDAGRTILDRQSVILVDEAGMAGFDVMERLMQCSAQSGAKLILMGDPEQLPAVSRGNVLRKLTQMQNIANTPNALLYLGKHLADWHRISRQKDDWAKQASSFFAQGFVAEGLREYETRGCLHAAVTPEHLKEDLIKAYLADKADPTQKLILATTNAQVNAMNLAVRDSLKAEGKLQGAWRLPDSSFELSLGDRIVFKQGLNKPARTVDHGAKPSGSKPTASAATKLVAKNDFATVRSIARQADGSLDVQCELDHKDKHGKPVFLRLNTKDMGELDHAFATTVHRSQGMTVDAVYAATGTFLSKELFYVMATRHRERFHLHLLEQDRAMIMQKAAQLIPKWHALDLQSLPGLERAAGDATSAIWGRLKGGLKRVGVWAQMEWRKYANVMRSHGAVPTVAHVSQRNAIRAHIRILLDSIKKGQSKPTSPSMSQRPTVKVSQPISPVEPAPGLFR
jgi:hypothetical protein